MTVPDEELVGLIELAGNTVLAHGLTGLTTFDGGTVLGPTARPVVSELGTFIEGATDVVFDPATADLVGISESADGSTLFAASVLGEEPGITSTAVEGEVRSLTVACGEAHVVRSGVQTVVARRLLADLHTPITAVSPDETLHEVEDCWVLADGTIAVVEPDDELGRTLRVRPPNGTWEVWTDVVAWGGSARGLLWFRDVPHVGYELVQCLAGRGVEVTHVHDYVRTIAPNDDGTFALIMFDGWSESIGVWELTETGARQRSRIRTPGHAQLIHHEGSAAVGAMCLSARLGVVTVGLGGHLEPLVPVVSPESANSIDVEVEQLRLSTGATATHVSPTRAPRNGTVVFFPGGPESYSTLDLRCGAIQRLLLSEGWGLVIVNYAGSTGIGGFRNSRPWHDWQTAMETEWSDLAAIVRRSGGPVVTLGWSFGAVLALKAGPVLTAERVVAGGTVVDFADHVQRLSEEGATRAAQWFERRFSAADTRFLGVELVDLERNPTTQFLHGEEDPIARFSAVAALVDQADVALDVRLTPLPGRQHDPTTLQDTQLLLAAIGS